MDNPRILSLCTGCGGIELGLQSVLGNCRTVAAVEIEAFAIANLVNKMETGRLDSCPIWSDLKSFDGRPFCGKVDILTGGYPCQPFSAAGKRLGDKDPRHLWPHIRGIIESVRPVWCFFENVEGHITMGLKDVLRDLEGMGYAATWGIFSAEECCDSTGARAPHRRKRVFILANSEKHNGWATGTGVHTKTVWESGAEGPENRGTELANRDGGRGEIQIEGRQSSEQMPGGNGEAWRTRWPARPGEQQYDWEEPRVTEENKLNPAWVENLMGLLPNWTLPCYSGTGDHDDNTHKKNEEGMRSLRKTDGQEEVQREARGFRSIQEKKILQPELSCGEQDAGGSVEINSPEEGTKDTGGDMCEVWNEQGIAEASRGLQKADGDCGAVPEMPCGSPPDEWDVGKFRVDRLRLLGNGVVPATAAKAWTVLRSRFND